MSDGERRLAAIMFTDMVGYTALGQRNESLSLALVEEQRRLIRPILARHNGKEIKTIGDAFLVEFPNALDSVRCAYDIQRATREFNFSMPADKRIHLRVGLHLGDVVESLGDISGDAVNIASRIEPLAEEGGVCLTRPVYESTRNKLDVPLVSTGMHALKNVSEPMEVYRMRMPWEEQFTARKETVLPRDRIAVLPFANYSPNPSDEYFADGLTEELIARLSVLKGAEVIARTSTMSYKGKDKGASQIGRELGAGTILEGSVRKAGNKIRVTAQLIDSNTEAHLWVESYDGELEDVFAVQRTIAEKVAGVLKHKLQDAQIEQIKRREPVRSDAYVEYLRGLVQLSRYDEGPIRSAMKHFERALELEPDYSAAMAMLSTCYANLGYMTLAPRGQAYAKARELATRAIELDETNAEAHTSMALAAYFDCDWSRSQTEAERALEVNPNYTFAHIAYAVLLQNFGHMDRALSEARKILELDPLSFLGQIVSGDVYRFAGMHPEAIAHIGVALEMDPQSPIAHSDYGFALISAGRIEEGVREIEKASALSGNSLFFKANLGSAYAVAGRREDAFRIVDEMKQASTKTPDLAAYGLAAVYADLGEKEEALNWLEVAYREHAIAINPLFTLWFPEPLRQDPRYRELVRKLGLDSFRMT